MTNLLLRSGKRKGGARRSPSPRPRPGDLSTGVLAAAVRLDRPGPGRLVDLPLQPPEHLGGVVDHLQPGGLAPAAPLLEGEDVAAGVVARAEVAPVTPRHRRSLPGARGAGWRRRGGAGSSRRR